MMRQAPSAGTWVLASCLLCAPALVAAQHRNGPARGGGVRRASAAQIEQARALLASAETDDVRRGIEMIGALGDPRAVEALTARVRRGLPPDLLDAAFDALLGLASPAAGPVLFELAMHRRPEVRLKAVEIIVHSRPRGGDGVLVASLSDSSAPVRSAAARGLGELGARQTLGSLFLALSLGVLEASTAIGRLAQPADVDRLLEYLGRLPFDAMAPALGEVLFRYDMPEAKKVEVIGHLGELATPEVKALLRRYVDALPPLAQGAARQAAQAAIDRIAD